MERANDVDKARRAADLQQNFPEGRPVDGQTDGQTDGWTDSLDKTYYCTQQSSCMIKSIQQSKFYVNTVVDINYT